MSGIDPSVAIHRLNVDPEAKPVRQKKQTMDAARNIATACVDYPDWLHQGSPLPRLAVQPSHRKKGQWEVTNVCRLHQPE